MQRFTRLAIVHFLFSVRSIRIKVKTFTRNFPNFFCTIIIRTLLSPHTHTLILAIHYIYIYLKENPIHNVSRCLSIFLFLLETSFKHLRPPSPRILITLNALAVSFE